MAGPPADPTRCVSAVGTTGDFGHLGCCLGPSAAAVWRTVGDASADPMSPACVLGTAGGIGHPAYDCHQAEDPTRPASGLGTSCGFGHLGCCLGPSAAAAQRTAGDAPAGPMSPACVLETSGCFGLLGYDCHQAADPTRHASGLGTSNGSGHLGSAGPSADVAGHPV